MVPAAYVVLDEFPRTPNGKVDRSKLPPPSYEAASTPRKITLPANASQSALAQAWEEMLGTSPISIDDDFFDLGGHSLIAVAIAARIEKRFGRSVSLADFYRHPTVERLAAHLDKLGTGSPVPALEEIQPGGSQPPLICVPSLYDLSRHLGPDQPFYGLSRISIEQMLDDNVPLEQMAAKFVDELKRLQRTGRFFIAGHSFGGVLAFEIARQLSEAGREIGILALLDPDPPQPYPPDTYRFSRFAFHAQTILRLPLAEKKKHFLKNIRNIGNRILPKTMVSEHEKWMRDFHRKTGETHACYNARPFKGNAVMFLATGVHWRFQPSSDPRNNWAKYISGKIKIDDVPGNHESVVVEPHVQVLARKLKDHLASACRGS
jgi:thioesterase domain-containing protein/acyl carrier protein